MQRDAEASTGSKTNKTKQRGADAVRHETAAAHRSRLETQREKSDEMRLIERAIRIELEVYCH